jgi:membrane associated rhomboid family serine protease
MFLPLGVDVPLDRRPVMNWLLIAGAVFAFFLQVTAPDPEDVDLYILHGLGLHGLFGHMWLHGGLFHIAGNLWFLFVFGNAVCAKIGNAAFLPLYIFFGLAAGLTHLLFDGNPMIGASGAINGVVGMYLVYFALNDVNCLFTLSWYYIRVISISGFWVIGMWFVFDVLGATLGGGNTAYFAHLGGFLTGVATAIVLLRFGVVRMESDERSLIDIFAERKRRQERQALEKKAEGYVAIGPHDFIAPAPPPRVVDLSPPKATEAVPSGKLRFTCSCGQRIIVPIAYAGQTGKCPGCKQRVAIPPTA